jgi:hypothetical protein
MAAIMPGYPETVTSKMAAIMPGYPEMVTSKMAARLSRDGDIQNGGHNATLSRDGGIQNGGHNARLSRDGGFQNGGLQHRNITEGSLQKGGLINRGFRDSFPNIKGVDLRCHIRSLLDGMDRVYVKGSSLCGIGSGLCVIDVTSTVDVSEEGTWDLDLPGGRGILDTSSSIGSSAPKRGQRDIRHIVRVVGQHIIPGRKSFAEKAAEDASVTALRN